jgi:hypothetical protein
MAFKDRIKELMSSHLEAELMEGLKHDRYMRAHGKKASGTGTWMFTTKKDGEVNYDNDKEVFQSGPSMKLGDAAKAAMKALGKTIYVMEAKLDPVGQEDDDIDNDGDVDDSDKFLHKRRKAIKAAINKKPRMKEEVKNFSQPITEKMGDDDWVHIARAGSFYNPKKDSIIGYSKSPKDPNRSPKIKAGANSAMRIGDAKKQGYAIKEEVELDEAATPAMMKAAKAIEDYAKKNGGIDKADFMKTAKMLSSGKAGMDLVKFVDDLDTDPREWLITTMGKHLGKQTVEKMFKVKIREEVELEETQLDEKAPKMGGDSIAIQRAKDRAHAKAMGRSVKTGRKLPKKTMTSTQRSLASLRGESAEVDEVANLLESLLDKIEIADLDSMSVEELTSIEEGLIKAIGVAAKKSVGGIAKGIGAAAHRVTTAGRADAAEKRLAKAKKKLADKARIADANKARKDLGKPKPAQPAKPKPATEEVSEAKFDVPDNFGMSKQQKDLANMGRKLMDMAAKEKNDMISNAMARLGDELTNWGTTYGAKNLNDLTKKTGLKPNIIRDLMTRANKAK